MFSIIFYVFLIIFVLQNTPDMQKIKLHDKLFRYFIPNERLEEAIDRVAARINDDYRDSGTVPILLCVLNGSILFTAELMKRRTSTSI